MAGRKRSLELGSSSSSSSDTPSAKRLVQSRTVQKWIADNEKTLNTTLWLKFEKSGREHVSKLSCSICKQFQEKLQSMRNYRPAFIEGTTNVKSSTFKEHAGTDMHKRAMMLFKKQHSSHVTFDSTERVFSQLKLIKSSRRTCIGEDTLDYLIRVNVEGPPLSQWDASVALELWSKEKARRVNQKESKAHQSQSGVSQEETLSSETSESLQQVWEDWIADTTADTTLTDGYEAEPPSDSD